MSPSLGGLILKAQVPSFFFLFFSEISKVVTDSSCPPQKIHHRQDKAGQQPGSSQQGCRGGDKRRRGASCRPVSSALLVMFVTEPDPRPGAVCAVLALLTCFLVAELLQAASGHAEKLFAMIMKHKMSLSLLKA